jgi:hypothetical protein
VQASNRTCQELEVRKGRLRQMGATPRATSLPVEGQTKTGALKAVALRTLAKANSPETASLSPRDRLGTTSPRGDSGTNLHRVGAGGRLAADVQVSQPLKVRNEL